MSESVIDSVPSNSERAVEIGGQIASARNSVEVTDTEAPYTLAHEAGSGPRAGL
jgi:hypothetical protein